MGFIFYKRIADAFFRAGGGITATESFEYEGSWPGTIQGGDSYADTFTGFNSPSASINESFELSDGWPA